MHHIQVLSSDFSRDLSHSIKILPDAQGHNDAHGTRAAELPGICDVNPVSDTMGDGISPSAWSRCVSKPEKPTQGAPARAECPVPAAKSAPSGVHSAQNAQVTQWRTRPIGWPSRRRNRLLCICTLHIHIAAPQHACRPQARAHVTGGGRAGSRRGIRTRRRLQARMDASERMGPGAPRRGQA